MWPLLAMLLGMLGAALMGVRISRAGYSPKAHAVDLVLIAGIFATALIVVEALRGSLGPAGGTTLLVLVNVGVVVAFAIAIVRRRDAAQQKADTALDLPSRSMLVVTLGALLATALLLRLAMGSP